MLIQVIFSHGIIFEKENFQQIIFAFIWKCGVLRYELYIWEMGLKNNVGRSLENIGEFC